MPVSKLQVSHKWPWAMAPDCQNLQTLDWGQPVHEKWGPHRNCIWSRKWHSSGLELRSSARGPGRPKEIKQIEVPAKIRFCRISSWEIGKGSWINIPQHSSERSPYACIGCIGIAAIIAWYSSQKIKPYCRTSLTTFGKVKRLHESHQHCTTAANHHILQCYAPNSFQKNRLFSPSFHHISSVVICIGKKQKHKHPHLQTESWIMLCRLYNHPNPEA